MTVVGVEICGASHILGRLSWAQHVLFLSLCHCLVAVTPPRPAGTDSLWGVAAGYGEVQWFSADLHTASTSHPALRSKHTLPVYGQDNLDCPAR